MVGQAASPGTFSVRASVLTLEPQVHHGRTLADANGELAALKKLVDDYPPALRQAMVRTFLWEADFAL